MAPRTPAWGWFEPSWWLEGFLEDKTPISDMASGQEEAKGASSPVDRLCWGPGWAARWLSLRCFPEPELLRTVIGRIQSDNAGDGPPRLRDLLIYVAVAPLPVSRCPLWAAALAPSGLPQCKVLGAHPVHPRRGVPSPRLPPASRRPPTGRTRHPAAILSRFPALVRVPICLSIEGVPGGPLSGRAWVS